MPSPTSSIAAMDAQLIDHRKRLLEVGRSDVNALLHDISEKYSTAIYYRDTEISQMRAEISRLTTALEEARASQQTSDALLRQQLEGAVHALKGEVASATRLLSEQREAHLKAIDAHDATDREKNATIAKLGEKVRKTKTSRKEASAAAEAEMIRVQKSLDALRAEVEAANASAADEKRRSDHYFKALKHSEKEAVECVRRMEEITAQHNDRHASKEWLEESLRLQLMNTRRLLGVLGYLGTSEGARHAQSLGRSIHAVASGGFQYIGHSNGGGGGKSSSPTAPSTVIQDLQLAIQSYSEAEAAATRRCLPPHAPPLSSVEPFRSLHAEKDRWIPSEAVAVVRHFHGKYFPNSKPDLFYGLLLQISTVLRDLCGLSPVDKLLQRVAETEDAARRRYGVHNNAFNPPSGVGRKRGGIDSLDAAKQSFPQCSSGNYYAERPLSSPSAAAAGAFTAAEEVRLNTIADAVQGLLLVRRNIVLKQHQHYKAATAVPSSQAPSSQTVVALSPVTVEEVCGAAIAALEDAAATIHREASEGRRYATAARRGAEDENTTDNKGRHFPVDDRIHTIVTTLNSLFGAINDGSSRSVQLAKGIADAATHLKESMRSLVGDIEKSRRAVETTVGGGGGAGPSLSSSPASELSGPYAILKAHVNQTIERYTSEIITIARATESTALGTREKSTRLYHKGLAQSRLEPLGAFAEKE